MGSKSLNTKQNQKARYSEEVDKRVAALQGQGLTQKEIARDSKVKHLTAKLRQIDAAVSRISFLEEQTQKLRDLKEQRKAEAEAAKLEARAGGKKAKEPAAGKKAAAAKKAQPQAQGAARGGKDQKKKKGK